MLMAEEKRGALGLCMEDLGADNMPRASMECGRQVIGPKPP